MVAYNQCPCLSFLSITSVQLWGFWKVEHVEKKVPMYLAVSIPLRTEAWLADTASCGKKRPMCPIVPLCVELAESLPVFVLVHTRTAEGIQQMGDLLLLLTFKTSTDAHFSLLLCMSNHWNDPEQCVNCNKASTFDIQKNKNTGGRNNSGRERLLANVPVPVMKCQD